jgi:hypothetical protein
MNTNLHNNTIYMKLMIIKDCIMIVFAKPSQWFTVCYRFINQPNGSILGYS